MIIGVKIVEGAGVITFTIYDLQGFPVFAGLLHDEAEHLKEALNSQLLHQEYTVKQDDLH